MTGLLLACFVANSLKIDVSYSSTKRSVQRNVKFGGSKAKAKLLSRVSHKVCRRLSSSVLLRKFTTTSSHAGSDSSPVVSKLSLLINYLLGKRLGYARGEDRKARGG